MVRLTIVTNAALCGFVINFSQERINKMRNKTKTFATRMTALAALCAVAVTMAACGTMGSKKPKQMTEILDDKGAALNIPTPEWVIAFVSDGNHAVEALAQYKNEHCFVIDTIHDNRDFAIGWVNNADGPAEVARMISTTVVADAQNNTSMKSADDKLKAEFATSAKSMADASYTGLRKMGDWWQLTRNKATKVEEYRAFALYTADKKRLDDQIAGNLQNIIDNNKELSAAARTIYQDIISGIHLNGFNNR